MGALVKSKKIREPFAVGGNVVCTMTYFTGPASYDTGGSKITAKDLGLTWILHVEISVADSADRKLLPIFNNADGDVQSEIKGFITDLAGTQVAGASNQSTKKFRVVAFGLY